MTRVQGGLSAVDVNGRTVAGIPGNISIQFRRADGSSVTSAQPGGVFGMQLPEGEYTVSLDRLPAGYTVKSILSGSIDITQSPLKVSGAQRLTEIQIVLESK